MGELGGKSYRVAVCAFPGCNGWAAAHTAEGLGMWHDHDGRRYDFEAVDCYEVGYADGHWTIRVPGGPAFMANAVAALAYAMRERGPGPSRDIYERLMRACIEASPE